MEFAKDEVFNIKYNDEGCVKENKFIRFISRNKFLFSMLVIGLAVSGINSVLIYNFFKTLSTL